MNAHSIDWNAYALGEMDAAGRRDAAAHMVSCESCRTELADVEATLATLAMLREEEVPRRIAFVSDKVFEPRWWQKWNPTFAAASVLAAAIVVHAFAQPPVADAAIQARVNQAMVEQMRDRMVIFNQMDQQLKQVYMAQMSLERH